MDSRFYDAEKERILAEVRKRLDELFPHKLHWPTCPYHNTTMCEVSKLGTNTYYECFEINDEGERCGHREFSI